MRLEILLVNGKWDDFLMVGTLLYHGPFVELILNEGLSSSNTVELILTSKSKIHL